MPSSIQIPYISRDQKIAFLQPILQMPWSMLLDSAGTDLDYNRFDILCALPTLTLAFDGMVSEINHANHSIDSAEPLFLQTLSDDGPLDLMRRLLKKFSPPALCPIEIPFQGGWLGYISYDFARNLEKLPEIAVDDINLPRVQMGLYQWALITDHQSQTSTIYNFGLSSQDWQTILSLFENLTDQARETNTTPFALDSDWQCQTSFDDYAKAFARIKHYLAVGDCYQVNYAQRFSASYQGNVLQAYHKLSLANQAPFSAWLNFEQHQILSLSPERFIETQKRHVRTQPIKGTRPRHPDPTEDQKQAEALLQSDKDRAENLMIVDLLRNDLSRTAAKGSVVVSELFGHYRFASVHHLISTIESDIAPQFDLFDLLKTTLPGGSITGAPKIRAMEIIEELEPVRRNLYCGIIGYLDFSGKMDSNICIRTLIAQNNQLYCWAGGGLVADSELSTEYQETFDKLAKILPVLKKPS